MAKVHVSFTLDSESDKRIVRWLESLGKGEKSGEIRKALHAYLGKGGVSLGDIYEAVQSLTVLIKSGVIVTQTDVGPQTDIPNDVLERLNDLGK